TQHSNCRISCRSLLRSTQLHSAMKASTLFVVTLVVLLVVQESFACPVCFAVAGVLGKKLIKNSYYSKCKSRNLPSNLVNECPKFCYGIGLSRGQAQAAAKVYANAFKNGCGLYCGHCEIKKFVK
ncbi:unnamed protein product, partial [Meganyctiphanes norvegica]